MKKNVIISGFILIASLFFGSTSFAQTKKSSTPVQTKKSTAPAQVKKSTAPAQVQQKANKNNNDAVIRQEVREKAIQTIQKGYETYASCHTPEYQEGFKRLFVNEEAPVFNDLLGLSTAKTLTAGKYARLLGESGVRNTIVTINSISILDEPYKEKDKWKVDVAFNKRMSYFDNCGIYYNSYDFYRADYNMEVTLLYDPVDKICRIERITGNVDSFAELPERFFVFKLTDERDRQLYYQRNPLKFNSGNQAIIEGVFEPDAFSHANPRVRKLNPTIDDCNIAMMNYGGGSDPVSNDKKVLLRLNYGLGIGEALSVKSEMDNKTSGSGFGLDVGYQFLSTEMFKLSAFGGLGLSFSTVKDLSYYNKDYSYNTANGEGDIDGDDYERHYYGLSIGQEVKLSELTIPVYLDAEIDFSEIVSAYADLGLRVNLNMGKDADTKSAGADRIDGVYKQYGVTFDEDWGHNGFSNSKINFNVDKVELDDVKSPIDLMAGAGLRFNIPETPVAIDLGVSYIMGLSPILENKSTVSNTDIIKYTWDGNGEREGKEHVVANLADKLESVKRQSLRLNIGLIFKF